MSDLQVTSITVPVLLKKLRTLEWLVPEFQREFVWSNAQIIQLVNSIIDSRPIGMVTLWEQQDDSGLSLEPISVPDVLDDTAVTQKYAETDKRPGAYYAVLDGRQRSTAMALAFGGLRALTVHKHSGRYFLDVTATEEGGRGKYLSSKEVKRLGADTIQGAVTRGLFPLATDDPDNLIGQWMEYLPMIKDPSYYPNNTLPDEEELIRRKDVLSKAFKGIVHTKLAVYVVPKKYDLITICDIFSTLNQTGVKVSPVDLIHSNLFADTQNDPKGPLLLREKLVALGELDGAVGWAGRDRPELVAQLVAAAYVASDTKVAPRATGRRDNTITSVKSGDLLALPAAFWRKVFDESARFANFLGGFQQAVAGGYFGMAQCPYPASAAVYVGLRWFKEFDGDSVHWTIEHLDRLYRAFFWRNALGKRYDQGFLTQIGKDIADMKEFLAIYQPDMSDEYWRTSANTWLEKVEPRPTLDSIINLVSDGSERGAGRSAAHLLHYARARADVINQSLAIGLDSGAMELHHIYPRDWCKNNRSALSLHPADDSTFNAAVNASANLMPMHRRTNNEWSNATPSTFLQQRAIDYDSRLDDWNWYFIDRQGFDDLMSGESGVLNFWAKRARRIATEIHAKTVV